MFLTNRKGVSIYKLQPHFENDPPKNQTDKINDKNSITDLNGTN